MNRIYPSCLPLNPLQSTFEEQEKFAIHSGWSKPPPLYFVEANAPLFANNYRDFFKQWHYYMEFANCTDRNYVDDYQFKEPTETFYPPGVICAIEKNLHICPTSGESGSPLMSQGSDSYNRVTTEGILSFIKGCAAFAFGKYEDFFAVDINTLFTFEETETEANVQIQISDNPLVYTRLHCYLPWIAEQYNLEFDYPDIPGDDSACFSGFGNPEDVADVKCSNTPSTPKEIAEKIERSCIFPYYVDGRLINDTCFKFNEENFLDPVSRCPIWEVTSKIDGINNYNSSDSRLMFEGYCTNAEGLLDPSLTCPLSDKTTPFSKCKNNCKGGKCMKNEMKF